MALIECHECGKQISTEAAFCPGCGAPPKKSQSNEGEQAALVDTTPPSNKTYVLKELPDTATQGEDEGATEPDAPKANDSVDKEVAEMTVSLSQFKDEVVKVIGQFQMWWKGLLPKDRWFLMGLAILVSVMILFARSEGRNWSTNEKVSLCKAYIGSMFGKPTSIIHHYMTDKKGRVYVRYKRPADGMIWSYSCEVKGSSMIWSGFLNYSDKWGRWREEDRVSIKYRADRNMALFTSPDTEKLIAVSL